MGDKMPSDHHHQDDIRSLFHAAAKDNVDRLNSLVQENKDLVSHISSHTDRTTPLHVSASHGHLAFTKSLLDRDSQLATVKDSRGQTPLHLASAEGHVDVVKVLLCADVCDRSLAPDNDGRMPLHLAVMRGKVDVVKELVAACPETLYVSLKGDTVLHWAVKYNQFPALKELVRLVEENDYYDGILTEGNQESNTILHLAVLLDRTQMVVYLLTLKKIKSAANEILNMEGFNAMEALEHKPTPEYWKRKELKRALKEGGVRSHREPKTQLGRILHFINTFFTVNWMNEARAQLIVVSTIITTITYQVAINPPGGVFQVSFTDIKNKHTVNMLKATHGCQENDPRYHKDCQLPGNAVFGYFNPIEFSILTVFNTGAFLGSLCVTVVLASGFPLRDPLVLSFFNLLVAFTLESLMLTFLLSVDLSIPLLRRTVLGGFESIESLAALAVFSALLTLNMVVLIFGLLKRPSYSLVEYIKSAFRKQNVPHTGRP